MTTPDGDAITPETAALAAQARREAEQLPCPDEIRDLAEAAIAHGGAPGMSSEDVRKLADKAIERAEQVVCLLRELSDLVPSAPGRDDGGGQ